MTKRKSSKKSKLQEMFNLPAPRKRETLPEQERIGLKAMFEKYDSALRMGEYRRMLDKQRYGEC